MSVSPWLCSYWKEWFHNSVVSPVRQARRFCLLNFFTSLRWRCVSFFFFFFFFFLPRRSASSTWHRFRISSGQAWLLRKRLCRTCPNRSEQRHHNQRWLPPHHKASCLRLRRPQPHRRSPRPLSRGHRRTQDCLTFLCHSIWCYLTCLGRWARLLKCFVFWSELFAAMMFHPLSWQGFFFFWSSGWHVHPVSIYRSGWIWVRCLLRP